MVGKLTSMTKLSCSRLPAVMGFSPYRTPNDELAATLDAIDGKPAPEWTGNEATRWGDALEPVILATAAERLGVDLNIPMVAFDATGIALSASIDGIAAPPGVLDIVTNHDRGIYVVGADTITVRGRGVLESKLTSSAPEDEPAAHRGPLQLQGAMLCAGLTWGAVAVLYRGIELRVFVYERSERVIADIVAAVDAFELRKGSRNWYAPSSPADAASTWARPDDAGPPVDLPVDAADLIDDILTAKQTIAAAENVRDAATADLMAMLGNATEGLVTDRDGTRYRVRWPVRRYKAQPPKVTPAKAAYEIRQKTLDIKLLED